MAVLSTAGLHALLWERDLDRRLVVTPILDWDCQVQKAVIDLRLGSDFVILHHGRTSGLMLDVLGEGKLARIQRDVERMVEKAYVPLGSRFVLHPHRLVLTASLEYVCIPQSYMAVIVGRSSWGRLGLNIATATTIAPGFKGCVTFEMVNLGSVPLGLYPGTRVAQLVVHSLDQEEAVRYTNSGAKYLYPIGPEFSKIAEDADWKLVERFHSEPPENNELKVAHDQDLTSSK